jgi:hypothetical protein
VALYERVTLKWRKAFAVFVGLALPHASYSIGVGIPEPIDKLRMLSEMIIQRGPLGRERLFHVREFPLRILLRILRAIKR